MKEFFNRTSIVWTFFNPKFMNCNLTFIIEQLFCFFAGFYISYKKNKYLVHTYIFGILSFWKETISWWKNIYFFPFTVSIQIIFIYFMEMLQMTSYHHVCLIWNLLKQNWTWDRMWAFDVFALVICKYNRPR